MQMRLSSRESFREERLLPLKSMLVKEAKKRMLAGKLIGIIRQDVSIDNFPQKMP